MHQRSGRTREIQGVEYRTETYQSEIFSLIVLIISIITSVLVMINICGLTSWLEATSVVGGLLIVLFSTKDVWAPDNINGLYDARFAVNRAAYEIAMKEEISLATPETHVVEVSQ